MKKLLSFSLALTLLLGMTPSLALDYGEELRNQSDKSYTQTFTDVPETHWAFPYIAEMVDRGVLNGYPDGTYLPDKSVLRSEFAKIMVNAAGLSAQASSASTFSDVKTSDWFHPFVETAKDYLTGYTSPGGQLLYKPDAAALREDIAVALVRIKGYDTSVADLGMLQAMFDDYNGISESAKRYVAVAVEKGLLSGYPDRTFRAQ